MKKIIVVFIVVFALSLFAKEEAEVKVEIDEATKVINRLIKNRMLKDYIPYNFSDAIAALKKAKALLDDGEEDEASFYAHVAKTLGNIATVEAKIRKTKVDILEAKIANYEKMLGSSKQGAHKIIKQKEKRIGELENQIEELKKKLEKQSEDFRAKLEIFKAGFNQNKYGQLSMLFFDKQIFKRRSTVLKSDGEDKLMKIKNVLSLFPKAKISIDCYADDWRESRAQKKAEKKANSIKLFFQKIGVDLSRITLNPIGKKKVRGEDFNKVEIILRGVKL